MMYGMDAAFSYGPLSSDSLLIEGFESLIETRACLQKPGTIVLEMGGTIQFSQVHYKIPVVSSATPIALMIPRGQNRSSGL